MKMQAMDLHLNQRLISAIFIRNQKDVEECLKDGADANCVDEVDIHKSALMLAVKRRDVGIVGILLSAGANVNFQNKYGNSSLHIAVENDVKAIVELLLKGNANTSIKNNIGKTPTDIARDLDLCDMITLLENSKKRKATDETCDFVNKKLKYCDSSEVSTKLPFTRSGLSRDQMSTGKDGNYDQDFLDKIQIVSDGSKLAQHGNIFQLKLLMLILWRAKECGYARFRLATELADAEKFDDVVFQYQLKEGDKWLFRLLQAKHKEGIDEKIDDIITERCLLSSDSSEPYALFKYFHSLVKVNQRTKENSIYSVFSDNEIQDIILITNANIHDSLKTNFCSEKIESDKLLKIGFANNAAVYKFNTNNRFSDKLHAVFKCTSDINQLIRKLTDCLMNNKQIDRVDIFKEYYYPLINEVFEIGELKDSLKFCQQFVVGEGLSKEAAELRTGLIKEISFRNFFKNRQVVIETFDINEVLSDETDIRELANTLALYAKGDELPLSQIEDYHAKIASEVISPKTHKFFPGFINGKKSNSITKLRIEFKKIMNIVTNKELAKIQFRICKEFGSAELPTNEQLLKKIAEALIDVMMRGKESSCSSQKLLNRFFLSLKKFVINPKTKEFHEVFINGIADNNSKKSINSNLNSKCIAIIYNFREIFINELINQGHIDIRKYEFEKTIKSSNTFLKAFIPNNNFEKLESCFVDQFCNLINLQKGGIILISADNIQKTSKGLDGHKSFLNNLQKLAGYVLIEKFSKIRFCSSFLLSVELPEFLERFRCELKDQLGEKFDSLYEYQFSIEIKNYKFNTCEEGTLTKKLPSLPTDDNIKEFFNKFKLIVNYPNRRQLNKLMIGEIENRFKELDSRDLEAGYYQTMHEWMADRIGSFFTPVKLETTFNSLREDIMFRELEGVTNAYFATVPENIKFKENSNAVIDFLQCQDTQILHINKCYLNLNRFSLVRLFEQLKENLKEDIRSYVWTFGTVFTTLKQLLNKHFSEKVFSCFNDDKRLNVIVIEYDSPIGDYDQLCNSFSNTLKAMPSKKIIVFGNDSFKFVSKLKGFQGMITKHIIQKYRLNDFTLKSQDVILGKMVIFQEKNITIRDLLNDFAGELLNSRTLNSLFNDKNEINIGMKLKNLFEICRYYIKRNAFQRDQSQSTKNGILRVVHNENEFNKIREDSQKDNMHWLAIDGSQENLEENHEKWIDNSQDCLIDDSEHQVIIISDIAGQGKSTLLASIGISIKQKSPSRWVEIVDLNEHNMLLKKRLDIENGSFKNFDDCLLFLKKLLKIKTSFELKVLKSYFKEKHKIVIMFDGYDEINPRCCKLVMNLIEFIVCETSAQVWVTTRPHKKKKLEKQFDKLAFSLAPFENREQIAFLIKFWQNKNLDLESVERYATALIDELTNLGSVMKSDFTGIPLQLKMIAEIFTNRTLNFPGLLDICSERKFEVLEQGVVEYCASQSQSKPTFPKRLNFYNLYNWFIYKKCEVYKEEKCKIRTESAEECISDSFPKFMECHRKLASYLIFNNQQMKILIPNNNDVIQILVKKCEKLGLIVLSNNRYHFIHRTFAEYFAADFVIQILIHLDMINSKDVVTLLLQTVFRLPKFKIIRTFINCQLKEIELPYDTIELIGSCLTKLTGINLNPKAKISSSILRVLCVENCETILEIVLNSLKHLKITVIENENNHKSGPLLHKSIDHNGFETFVTLVKNGADIYVKNKDGHNSLCYAALKGRLEVCKWLIKPEHLGGKGADVFARDEFQNTLLHIVTDACQIQVNVWEWLLNLKLDVNAQNSSGQTVVHLASRNNRLNVVQWLISNGADANIADVNGKTPLYLACRFKSSKTFINKNLDLCKLLVQPKQLGGGAANVHIKTNNGNTLMHAAASANKTKLCKWLKKQGVVINKKNQSGFTPYDEAVFKNYQKLMVWFKKW